MKNFLKPAGHQHKDPQARLVYINGLEADSEQAQNTLCTLARDDNDTGVRLAAIARLNELNVLRELLDNGADQSDQPDEVRQAAQQRLVDKLTEGNVSDQAVKALLRSHASHLAVAIASDCVSAQQRTIALESVSDESSLVTVVQQSRFHDTRLAAAQRLTHHDALRSALSAVRSKDKVVAKHIQQRLDSEAAAEADLIARRHAINTTVQDLEALSDGLWTPQHGGKLQALKERWNSFTPAEREESEPRVNKAIATAEEALTDYLQKQEQVQSSGTGETASHGNDNFGQNNASDQSQTNERNSAAHNGTMNSSPGTMDPDTDSGANSGTDSRTEPSPVPREVPALIDDPALTPVLAALADSPIAQLAQRIESIESKSITSGVVGSESAEIKSVTSDSAEPESVASEPAVTEPATSMQSAEPVSEPVQNLLAYGRAVAVLFDPPYDVNKARPGALQQRIKRVSALLDIHTVLPGIDVAEHVYVKELDDHVVLLKDRISKAQQESADRIRATHRQFAALAAIIKEGKWGPANSMMRRLVKKIDAMESAERSTLNEKLQRAETQLAEMADWQDFAARPKLEALCESMEGLPAQELPTEQLAKQVREMQNAWKALGVSRASNELWSRFKTAGDTAYEPCKAFFEQKQQERVQKLDAKAALCDALESEHAALAEDPDWKAIARRVNNAKREWTSYRVPDRKPDKALEARFSAALKPFETALGEQYTANAAAKQELVEKVQALAEAEITQHSANQAKRLLSAWKLVGVMRRKEDQALWESFNAHLGTIFKHQHKVEREKQRAGLQHVFRAKDIIKRLKVLSRGDSIDDDEVQALATEFHALEEFPERDKKFLLRDFRQALDACSRVQENAVRRRKLAGKDEAQRLLELCEQLEAAAEDASSAADNLVEDVTHAWSATEVRVSPELDSVLQARRDQALAHIEAGTQPDYEKNEAIRRDLLIRMEVAAGVETPAEDKARRMQYQLENLQQGMTSAGIDDARQILAELDQQWLATGPAKAAVKDALHSRYLKAYKR